MASPSTTQLTPNPITPNLLDQLVNLTGPCASLIMPTHEMGSEIRQDGIRLRNLLDQLERELKSDQFKKMGLDQLRSLQENESFWKQQGKGLAFFANQDQLHCVRLEATPTEATCVADGPNLKAILPTLDASHAFALLTLSWEEARLYRTPSAGSSEKHLESWDTDKLPVTYNDLITPRDPEEHLQFTSQSSEGKSAATPQYHGQGEGEDRIDADRKNYLSRVSQIVSEVTYNSDLPIVLVATEKVAGQFRARTDLKIAHCVTAAPASLAKHEIVERAKNVVSESLRFDTADFGERLGTAVAGNKGSTKLEEIALAAKRGRIDTLVINPDFEAWGEIDESKEQVTVNDESNAGIELVNFAVLETLRNSGTVHCDEGFSQPVAAIYRY